MPLMILLTGLLLTALGILAKEAAGTEPALVPGEIHADFEGGHIDGWASYPAFSDTAYDFTILPGFHRDRYHQQGYVSSGEYFYPNDLAPPARPADNQYYLLRSFRPNSSSPQSVGVWRKFSLYSAADSFIEFDYWHGFWHSPSSIELQLAGGDGVRYRYALPSVERERWQRVRVPISAFRGKREGREKALAPGLELQALAIVSHLEEGRASAHHFFAVDNVRLTGQKQAGFALGRPEARAYEHWPMHFALEHYRPGDVLDIVAASEAPLRRATVRLVDYDGNAVASERAMNGDGTRWALDGFHTFSSDDRRGPLMLELEGETTDGRRVLRCVRLWLVEPPSAGEHPRLFFRAADREQLRQRALSGMAKRALDRLKRQARSARERFENLPEDAQFREFPREYLLSGRRGYSFVGREAANAGRQNAIVWYLTGDEEAGEFAKRALLTQAGYDQWIHPMFQTQGRHTYLHSGQTTIHSGINYDLIYDLLSEKERAFVRRGMMEKGVIPGFQEYFLDNRIPNNTSNWIAWTTAAPMVSLLAMYGELESQGHRANGEPYFSALAEKFFAFSQATMRADGGFGEGVSYQLYAMGGGMPLLAALDHAFGVKDLHRSLSYKDSYLFPLYVSIKNYQEVLDMGDSNPHRGSSSSLAWILSRSRDPVLKFLYDNVPGFDLEDLLYVDDELPAAHPAEVFPAKRIFPDKGNAVFRTGWDDDAIVLNFRAGPNYNHTHVDQGHFRYWGWGDELVSEAGKRSYYEDPYYWSYSIQAAGHNVILVNENPESQLIGDFANEVVAFDDYARMKNTMISPVVNWATADLAPVYRDPMREMTRRLYFVDPGYLVIHDTVRSDSGPHTYQWQLHPPSKNDLEAGASGARIHAAPATLKVEVIEPRQPRMVVRDASIPIDEYADFPDEPLRPRAILQVTHERPLETQEFLVAILPQREGFEGPHQARRLDGRGYQGLAAGFADGREDRFYFAVDADGIEADGLITDGRAAFFRRDGGRTIAGSAERATRLALPGGFAIELNRPANVALTRDAATGRWSVKTEEGVEYTSRGEN